MMYLKESFRYQNFIERMIDRTFELLHSPSVVMETKQWHLKSKANPDAKDEEINVEKPTGVDYAPNVYISFLERLLREKEGMSRAISAAKAKADFDIDAEISNNKLRQRVVGLLNGMAGRRPSEKTTRAYDYKFNAEGNQVQYVYEVKEVSTINFDRNKVKAISRGLSAEIDKISSAVDKFMVELDVDFTPMFDVNDSYEDAIEAFVAANAPSEE